MNASNWASRPMRPWRDDRAGRRGDPVAMRRRKRCSVVRDLCGHGLGRLFHGASPTSWHYGRAGEGVVLRRGN